jgi:1,2-diacylglycerol 3-beta-galactosyltransferase
VLRATRGPDAGRVVLLLSETGQGHRSVGRALEAALTSARPDLAVSSVDVLTGYAPFPYDRMPVVYSHLARSPLLWRLFYALGSGPGRASFFNALNAQYARSAADRLMEELPADLYVCLHPALQTPVLRAARRRHGSETPFVTVVTDLVSMSVMWFDPDVDLCVVPTDEALRLGLRLGMPPAAMRVRGLPVGEAFRPLPPGEVATRRTALGWATDRPVVLICGGGDGVGPLAEAADSVSHLDPPPTVVVVAGRNRRLYELLVRRRWPAPVHVYEFVEDMSRLMAAADVMVTKAGPSAMHEAFHLGLPLVLCYRLAQEEGNVAPAVEAGAACWAPTAGDVSAAVRDLLTDPARRAAAARASAGLAWPQAAAGIAEDLLDQLDRGRVRRTGSRRRWSGL